MAGLDGMSEENLEFVTSSVTVAGLDGMSEENREFVTTNVTVNVTVAGPSSRIDLGGLAEAFRVLSCFGPALEVVRPFVPDVGCREQALKKKSSRSRWMTTCSRS